MNDEGESRARAGRRVLEHLQVAVGIAKGCDWASADVLLNADRFAHLVVDEVDLGKLDKNLLAVAQLDFQLAAAADDLLGRHSIDLLAEDAHEIDTAA